MSCISLYSSSALKDLSPATWARRPPELRLIFDETAKRRSVYLFDEFDAVGGHRTATNDVAEMRRVLNSFLQFMEEGNSTDSVIICSTNHPSLLDRALLRRYDQVLEFDAPTSDQIKRLISSNLGPMKIVRPVWKSRSFTRLKA